MESQSQNNRTNLRNEALLPSSVHQYILETSVYPREHPLLKELREATAGHPKFFFATSPDAGQLLELLQKLVNPKKTIEVGVFTGYSLLLTALFTPDDAKITAIDVDREAYEVGLPIIQKAGVEHKIDFIQGRAVPLLDQILQDSENEESYDFAYVDANKDDYWNYHQKLMKLVKIGGMIIYDNTLWGGAVAYPEESVPVSKRAWRKVTMEFNTSLAADRRVELAHASVSDGVTICKRIK